MAKIDILFQALLDKDGSDLHLEQGQHPKIRLHGELVKLDGHAILNGETIRNLMTEIISIERWEKFEKTGDLDFAYAFGNGERFRANYFKHFNGYGAIFRIIPSKILTLEQLGMPDVLMSFANYRSGLVLITGPTGSGKSTTLAAIIDHINQTLRKKIITIEEPVEFMHKNVKCVISHREVGPDTKSFSSGLRGALKSDVDVILVGEMRDIETINLALNASQMGILVFGTLHTNSAGKTIDRIIDVFPANRKDQIRAALANNLKGVVSQQLCKSADGSRRYCAYEILLRSPSLAAIIRTGQTVRLTSEIQVSKSMGSILMDECLTKLLDEGKITKEEAHLKALDKTLFSD
jgi:twitching motility protein PilT